MTTRLPAEWEPQSGVMLTWPHEGTDWANRLDQAEPVFAHIGTAISRYESLLSVCQSDRHAARIKTILLKHGANPDRLLFSQAESNDTWARDYGPLTTLNTDLARLIDFRFNGWGHKFDAEKDDSVTSQLVKNGVFANAKTIVSNLVIEGGAIETDGHGTLLATRDTIISTSRNPNKDQAMLESALNQALGIQRFLWLDNGAISGDDTDGHIDTLARFADPKTILYATAPPGELDHPSLVEMEHELHELRTADGQPYRLLALPFPGVHEDDDGRRLPATYANFLIINQAVLLPVYGVDQDTEAVTVMRRAFPGRDVISIDCREIIRQNGSLHCLTMQFPQELRLQNTLDP